MTIKAMLTAVAFAAAFAATAHVKSLEDLERFRGSYGFCKAHAAGFAALAWQEAYLKARHPLAFWVACLNHHTEGNYPRRVYVEAAKRDGLAVHGVCVNRSALGFTQEGDGVRVGLNAVRSLSGAAAEAVIHSGVPDGTLAPVCSNWRSASPMRVCGPGGGIASSVGIEVVCAA